MANLCLDGAPACDMDADELARELSTPEGVERMRRSLCMLAPDAQGFTRNEAMVVLELLADALRQLG